jgi:uncharacterized protein GlcG (DUF336 family)
MTTQTLTSIDFATAHTVLHAALDHATEIGVPMNVAVVDAGGNLVAFARQDGAWLGSIDISKNKAYTARAFDMPTADLQPMVQPGQPLYGIEASNDGKLIAFPGGIPLKRGDEIIGAIGVSGGMVDQDQAVAEAGVTALQA